MKRIKIWAEINKQKIILYSLGLLLITLSFGLGYLTNREFNRAKIIIEKCSGTQSSD